MAKITNSHKYFIFMIIGYICYSQYGLVRSPVVIKAQDQVRQVQDQDQEKSVSRPLSRPKPAWRPPTLLISNKCDCSKVAEHEQWKIIQASL